jgi:hypothetical protein
MVTPVKVTPVVGSRIFWAFESLSSTILLKISTKVLQTWVSATWRIAARDDDASSHVDSRGAMTGRPGPAWHWDLLCVESGCKLGFEPHSDRHRQALRPTPRFAIVPRLQILFYFKFVCVGFLDSEVFSGELCAFRLVTCALATSRSAPGLCVYSIEVHNCVRPDESILAYPEPFSSISVL